MGLTFSVYAFYICRMNHSSKNLISVNIHIFMDREQLNTSSESQKCENGSRWAGFIRKKKRSSGTLLPIERDLGDLKWTELRKTP